MRHLTPLALGALALALTACGSASTNGQATTTGSASVGGSATASAASYDLVPEQRAATWIVGQLHDGVIHDQQYQFDDYGTSADVALALAAVGGHDAEIHTIAAAVTRHQQQYVAPGYGTLLSAGAVAKSIVLDQAAGTDPGALVAKLDGLVTGSGRAADRLDPANKKAVDYANTISQSLAVRALDKAGDAKAAAATRFLIDQQCDSGGFRLYFPESDAGAQTCAADKKATPDVDATAFAVLALLQAGDQPGAAAAAAKAVTWLSSTQGADGSFDASQPAVPNANSTGLAGWALGTAGSTVAASKAATWVAKHQLGCASKDSGAIAYDAAGLKAGTVSVKTAAQFRSATSQALPALQWLPAGAVESGSC